MSEVQLEKLSSNKTFEGELVKYKFKVRLKNLLLYTTLPSHLYLFSQLLLEALILSLTSTYHQMHLKDGFLSWYTLQA